METGYTFQFFQFMIPIIATILAFTLGFIMYPLERIWNSLSSVIVQVFSFLVLFLTPISNYIHIVLVLIFIDLITGSYASIVEGQKFSAAKMKNTVKKFIFYSIAIISGYLLQHIASDGSHFARLVALYLGSIEVKSNYENIGRITGTDTLNDLWRIINDRIKQSIKTKTKTD